ncbi:hypothetical protein A1O7_05280 [Cladophialophora yegresii CBS 114405]|uniref:Uncharacterized protein n=1 Tax=Cladophialophora yegresii CBS 114405 TaxID=1182544 RepID=W9VZ62_9EURO|nr:uncharacterized protein A1O7_05280 [Cladophialophora yegresii CBS 114405]EXJ61127.1 hypothetical protein A1O7_05280 [Cladophialophora yegresii CBS 114405]
MDEKGVMLVNGVEFVNVISVKARIESDEDEQSRKRIRERADSGLGIDVTQDKDNAAVGTRAMKQLPPLPLRPGQRHKSAVVTAAA